MDSVAAPSMTEPTVDAALVDVRAGDAGFDAWAAERSRSLLIFATAVTGDREAARDAVQDALVAVYLRWRRLIVGGEPDAYARRIIVNRHISWWRRLGRRERLDGVRGRPCRASPSRPRRGWPTPTWPGGCWPGCPRRQRAAVALRFYDDLAFAEIATVLDCTESTARSYVHRALERLRSQLRESDDD